MRKEMVTLLASSFILLSCIFVASFWGNIQREKAQDRLTHSYKVIGALEAFLSNLKDIENGARNYVLTRNKSFLEPYQEAKLYYNLKKTELLSLNDQKEIKHDLVTLFMLAEVRIKKTDNLLKLTTKNTNIKKLLAETGGNRLMDAVRLQTANLISHEKKLLNNEIKKNSEATVRFTITFWTSFIIILVMQGLTFYLMNNEIEQRKKSELSLSKLNDNLENIVEERTDDLKKQLSIIKSITSSVQTGIIQMDTSSRIFFANEAAANLLSAENNRLLGQSLFNLVKDETNSILMEKLNKVLIDGGTTAPAAITLTSALGRPVNVLMAASATMLGNIIIGAVVSFQDLTDMRLLEKEKEETLAQFEKLADSLPQLAWMADGKGDIYWYNQRWYDYTGTTLEKMKGWGWKSVHHPDHLDRVIKRIKHSWDTGEVWEDTFPLKSKDETYRWFLSRALPIRDEQNLVVKWFGTNTDITEQIQSQIALKEREAEIIRLNQGLELRVEERTLQLKTINKELETFSYSVSHDLRAPLRSISGFSQALLKQKSSQLDFEAQDYLKRILNNAQKMGTLIDDLLQLSRLTRGELNKEPVNLSELAQQIIDTLNNESEDSLPTSITIEPELWVNGDKRLLFIALENLLNNAWKFSSHSKKRVIKIGKKTDSNSNTFYISDNGAGFEMAYVHKLFGAFQRLHAMDEFPGNGIGLATVQRIIHRHNGEVWATSEPEQGAIFYFTL